MQQETPLRVDADLASCRDQSLGVPKDQTARGRLSTRVEHDTPEYDRSAQSDDEGFLWRDLPVPGQESGVFHGEARDTPRWGAELESATGIRGGRAPRIQDLGKPRRLPAGDPSAFDRMVLWIQNPTVKETARPDFGPRKWWRGRRARSRGGLGGQNSAGRW